MAGASSIFYGERLLTTPNAEEDADVALLEALRLDLAPLCETDEAGMVEEAVA